MNEQFLYAYHVVTDRPMELGQHIVFDALHHNGVYRRVMEKLETVEHIYAHPEQYDAEALEHHTRVALRELALEEVRQKHYPSLPSRMACLYVSDTLEEAQQWFDFFTSLGRPTYQIVKLRIAGRCFRGDAINCFAATLEHDQNLLLSERYWSNQSNPNHEQPIYEMLVDGDILVVEIVRHENYGVKENDSI